MSTRDRVGGFDPISVRHRLLVVDETQMTMRTWHEFELRAVRRERFYERQYTYSGIGVEKDPIVTSGVDELGHARHRLHGPIIREGEDRVMIIDLGRWLNPGDVETVTMEYSFIDPEQHFNPFLGVWVKPECAYVDLQVLLPRVSDMAVRAEERPPDSLVPRSRVPLEGEDCLHDELPYRRYRFTKTDPEPGCNVRISWIKQAD